MKTAFLFVAFLLLATAVSQQRDKPRPKGAIQGITIGDDGQPAKGIRLTAHPVGGVVRGPVFPSAITNDTGEYRFENLPRWGRYSVYAEDDDAGYSRFSTGPADCESWEVEVTPAHPEAEFKVYLPPKAGFLQIHLTNRSRGFDISRMRVVVMPTEGPESPGLTIVGGSSHVILVPPDKNLLLHVTSDGFREWDESVGSGKPLYLPSGARLTLDVQLEPSD